MDIIYYKVMESTTTALDMVIYAVILVTTVVMFALTLTTENPEKTGKTAGRRESLLPR
jgi:hypothetical protein